MTAPAITITYFDNRGRAEPLRLTCILGDLPFTDDRFDPVTELASIKPKTPYQSVPTMLINSKIYAQSNALLRYLGKITGLYPDDPMQALHVDEVVDTMEDFLKCCFRYFGPEKERLRVEREKMVAEDIPRYIGGLEKRMTEMGEGPFAVRGSVTIGDLLIVNTVNNFKSGVLEFADPDALDEFQRVMQCYRAVMTDPRVVEWYQKYPIPNVSVPLDE